MRNRPHCLQQIAILVLAVACGIAPITCVCADWANHFPLELENPVDKDDCHGADDVVSVDDDHCAGCGEPPPVSVSSVEATTYFSAIHVIASSPLLTILPIERYPFDMRRHAVVRRTPISAKDVLLI